MNLFLIGEIGINHNGDLDIAKKLIQEAKNAGFDSIKFQKRDINLVYSKKYLETYRESPWGTTQREQKEGLEFNEKQYDEIDSYCKKLKIYWFASAWDVNSQIFLRKYNLKYNKLASPLLGHKPLIKKILEEKKKTFVSTGMSTMNEIEEVVKMFRDNQCPFELMHCNSTYPLKEDDANLNCIPTLRKKFKCDVGWSGHESSLLKVSIAAICLGATSVERHITLDRTMYGSDQAASVEASSLKNLAQSLKKINSILGDGKKEITKSEVPIRKKLRIKIDN
jgi:N-acetylneuraminate synthase